MSQINDSVLFQKDRFFVPRSSPIGQVQSPHRDKLYLKTSSIPLKFNPVKSETLGWKLKKLPPTPLTGSKQINGETERRILADVYPDGYPKNISLREQNLQTNLVEEHKIAEAKLAEDLRKKGYVKYEEKVESFVDEDKAIEDKARVKTEFLKAKLKAKLKAESEAKVASPKSEAADKYVKDLASVAVDIVESKKMKELEAESKKLADDALALKVESPSRRSSAPEVELKVSKEVEDDFELILKKGGKGVGFHSEISSKLDNLGSKRLESILGLINKTTKGSDDAKYLFSELTRVVKPPDKDNSVYAESYDKIKGAMDTLLVKSPKKGKTKKLSV